MREESFCLLGGIVLGIVHIMTASAAATRQRGSRWNLSSREQDFPPLKGFAGRVDRAAQNFKETFPFFVAALVLLQSAGSFGWLSHLGAGLYLGARLLYFPVYAAGIIYVRSALWLTSMLGIVLIVAQLFIS